MPEPKSPPWCSFCGKTSDEHILIKGPDILQICEPCVAKAVALIAAQRERKAEPKIEPTA